MRVFSVLLLLLVGTVFVTSPAALLAKLTPESIGMTFWTAVILGYYVLATLLPIDKIIGKLYPVFGLTLLVMAFGIIAGLLAGGYRIPEVSLCNSHPGGLPVWPYMFVTVACGAISGFHATQSPLIAKCITSEKQGRSIFYGAMIAESVIALVWAAAGTAFYDDSGALLQALTDFGQSAVVYDISKGVLGSVGGIPAAFMTAVSVTYILMSQEGLSLPAAFAYPAGIAAALAAFIWCCRCASVYYHTNHKTC